MLRLSRTWSFHVVVLQRTAKKCTKIFNARAQLLFSSLNLLFGDVLVDIVVCSDQKHVDNESIKNGLLRSFLFCSIRVVVEDKESSGGAFSMKVSPTATIERLQQEVTC